MVTKLNVGIIGFGWVARDYMYPAIQRCALVELTAVCSADAADMMDLPPLVRQFVRLDDMLRETDLDAVYIATPNHLHSQQTVACLEAGLHVLCEKPMATTSEDATAMIAAAEQSGRVYATAYDQRFHPAHQRIYELLQEKRLGTITQVKIDYACWLAADWAPDNWRVDQQKAGGGAIIDLAPHGLDLLETLLSDTITELHLYQQTVVQDYTVDDGGVLLLRFSQGALGSMHVGYNRPDALPRRRLEIVGTQGMLVAENTMGQDEGGTLTFVSAEDGSTESIPFDIKQSPFEQQIRNFAESVLTDKKPIRSPKDDLRLFRLLSRALQQEAAHNQPQLT